MYKDGTVTTDIVLIPWEKLSDDRKEIIFFNDRFEKNIGIRWGIAFKNETRIIGTVGYNKVVENHIGRIGYELLPEYWGKGLMTEALSEVIHFGFEKLNIKRIEAEVMKGNTSSEKLLTNLNFKKEGILRQWMYWNETFYDIIMFSLLSKKNKD